MRVFALLAALAALVGVAPPGDEPVPSGFRLADGSAGCAYRDGVVACRSAGNETAAVLERDGDSRAEEVAVDWDETTPVLLPAESWWHAGFSCRVRGARIACTAGDGAIWAGGGRVGGVR